MYFWSGITTLVVLGVWGFPANAQIGENRDIEGILTAAAEIQQRLFEKFDLDGVSTTNCLISGVKSRNIDVLQLKLLADFIKTQTGIRCNTLDYEWKYDFQDFFQPDNAPLHNSKNEILSATCGKYPSAVWNAVGNGQTPLTKQIILGLLATVQPNVTTPDAITLLENSVKIIENVQIDAFHIHENQKIFLEISKEVMTQNHLSPHENYQLTEMAAAQTRIQPIPHFNIFSIIRPNTFPRDVINARDAITKGIDDGDLEVCSEGGWSTPPDQLLALVTSLTAVPNDHPLASSVHVLYPHVRMWYFCIYGYQYVPRTFNDIVFLLNSFLTIRNPTLLREVYLEFAKIPWQQYTTNLEYGQYCDPRSLMIDIVKSILNHPDGLKVCNTILLNYFIHADDDCPHWLKPIFPTNSTHNPPLEVIPPKKEHRQPTTTEAPKMECDEGEIEIIEPESLITIFDSKKHPVVAEILRENPYPVHSVSYNSREAAFKHILGDLIKTRTDYTKVKQRAMQFAQRDMLLNENRVLPVELGCLCLGETDRKNAQVECEEDERRVVNPDSLIEIFERMDYPLLEEFLRNHPSASDGSDRYLTLVAILRKSLDDVRVSKELRAIFELFLGAEPPINRNGGLAVTWMCRPKCNLVSVVNQDSLIGIIDEKKITPIKNLIYWQPIYYEDYTGLETREKILKKVLSDRRLKVKDDILPLIIEQAIQRLRISWKGTLPPIIDEICEHDLKYLDTFEPVEEQASPVTCENVTIINQQSLMEIIGEDKINVLKNLVFMEPVMYEDYQQLRSREEVLKTVLYDRMVQVNDDILNLVVPQALQRLQINWRGMLPPVTEETCTKDLIYNVVTPVPPIDDDIVCDDSVPEVPDCGADEDATLIADTNSLFDALEETAPRATVIRQRVRASVFPLSDGTAHLKSYVLRDILLELREEVENQRLAYEVDQLLVSIHYGDRGLVPVSTKYVCLAKEQECDAGEQLMEAIDVNSLWDALEEKTPIPLHIMDSVETYLVPVQKLKSYRKSDVLREILEDLLEDTDDLASRERINELMVNIRDDGPAREDAHLVLKCIPDNADEEVPCDKESSGEMDVGSSEIQATELPLEIQNQELLQESSEEVPTPSPTAATFLESSEECEDSEEMITPSPTTTAATLSDSSEECEDSEEVITPGPTTTAATLSESSEECEDSEEVTTPYPTTTGVLLDSWEDFIDSGEVITSNPTTMGTLLESSEDCEESDEVSNPSPTLTVEEVTESSLECDESVEETTESIALQEATTENDEECDESEEIPTTEATTTEASTELGLPAFGKLPPSPQQPLTECPCPEGTVFTQVLNNQDLVDLLPLTETSLRYQLSQLIIPTNLAGTPKCKVLQAALKHLQHPELLPAMNQSDTLSITTLCAPQNYAELHTADTLGCNGPHPWWLNQCYCKHGKTLVETFLSHDIYNLLPHWERELRHDISLMVFPVSQFSGRSRRQILEIVLQSMKLTSHIPHNSEGNDFPRITAVCAQPGLYPDDELACPAEGKIAHCIYPMEIVDTKALMSAVADAHAFVEAKELLKIIKHSWIDISNFGDTDTKAQVFEKILHNLRLQSEAELQFDRKNHIELKKLLQQIEYLSAKISINGEVFETVTICV